ncbi:MAG: hypothetical protein ACI9W4_000540 [Rhodothermales bacterium]|jgi:hypothetical protein
MEDDDVRSSRFQNYHRFLFLKVKPDDRITFDAEVLGMTFYELAYKLGDPFTGLMLPNVWP